MPHDEVDPSLITCKPRKRKLTSYITNEDNISADKEATVKRLKETVKPTLTVRAGVENEAVRPPPKKTPPSISDSEPSDDDRDPTGAEPRREKSSWRRKKNKKKARMRTTSKVDDTLESADEEEACDKIPRSRHCQQKSRDRQHKSKTGTGTLSDSNIEILESSGYAKAKLGQSQNDSK
jgi:hypothetical protein